MEYKRLGKTNLLVLRIGFGGLAIGSFHYGRTKNKESITAIKKALKLGVNFFDTADIYSFGKSEKLLAEGLGNNRNKVIIATKVGVRWDKKKNKSYYNLSPNHIKQTIKRSLANLRLKTIPLYQIHYPDSKTNPALTMIALNKLRKERKIRYIGCSNFKTRDITKYQKYGRIESIQLPYNIIDQKSEKLISLAFKRWKMGVIVFSPLAQGLLTGNYRNFKFSKNDRRNKSPYFRKRALKKVEPLFKKMKKIGKKYSKTKTQIALRWILDNPLVTCAIVGVKTEEEIKEAAGAMNWQMTEKERDELTKLGKKVLSKNNFKNHR